MNKQIAPCLEEQHAEVSYVASDSNSYEGMRKSTGTRTETVFTIGSQAWFQNRPGLLRENYTQSSELYTMYKDRTHNGVIWCDVPARRAGEQARGAQ